MKRFRRQSGAALATVSLLLQGCYVSLPLQQTPPAITEHRVELILNDQGRVALANRLGTAVDKIEGQLAAVNNGSYDVLVYRVSQLQGSSATWNGEKVTVLQDQITGFQIRRLDRRKTATAAALVVGGIVAIFVGAKLAGSGGDKTVEVPPPSQSVRVP